MNARSGLRIVRAEIRELVSFKRLTGCSFAEVGELTGLLHSRQSWGSLYPPHFKARPRIVPDSPTRRLLVSFEASTEDSSSSARFCELGFTNPAPNISTASASSVSSIDPPQVLHYISSQ